MPTYIDFGQDGGLNHKPRRDKEIWGPDVGKEVLPPEPGYHLADIPKGVYGEASKITEEAAEFADAVAQGVSVMALVELADLMGAVEAYLAKHHPSVSMADLMKMSAVTTRAFMNGDRT
jgi:phosphoribosyl-ATP pyrophosphohydrolase